MSLENSSNYNQPTPPKPLKESMSNGPTPPKPLKELFPNGLPNLGKPKEFRKPETKEEMTKRKIKGIKMNELKQKMTEKVNEISTNLNNACQNFQNKLDQNNGLKSLKTERGTLNIQLKGAPYGDINEDNEDMVLEYELQSFKNKVSFIIAENEVRFKGAEGFLYKFQGILDNDTYSNIIKISNFINYTLSKALKNDNGILKFNNNQIMLEGQGFNGDTILLSDIKKIGLTSSSGLQFTQYLNTYIKEEKDYKNKGTMRTIYKPNSSLGLDGFDLNDIKK